MTRHKKRTAVTVLFRKIKPYEQFSYPAENIEACNSLTADRFPPSQQVLFSNKNIVDSSMLKTSKPLRILILSDLAGR